MRRLVLTLLPLAICMSSFAKELMPATSPATDSAANVAETPPAPELRVKPWREFGTGKADGASDSVNPPDGLAFTAEGLLLATDAKNHRVQVFDPTAGAHLGSFGGPDVFTGDVVGIAVGPGGDVVVSDETANRAYVFTRKDRGASAFVSAGPPIFGGKEWRRLTSVAYDSAGRFYAIDGGGSEVRRYLPGFVPDACWTFQGRRPDGEPMLHHADGIAIDEKTGTVFIPNEWDGVVLAFDAKTGRWLGKAVGRRCDPVSAKPTGKSVFSRSVEGLAILGDYLLAVDEGFDETHSGSDTNAPGRLLVFRLDDPELYQTDADSCRKRMAAGQPAGLVGWLGDFSSPDGVAVFAGAPQRPEPLVAVADQRHYRVVLYKGNELIRAIHPPLARASR
jgi:hypothetical protein